MSNILILGGSGFLSGTIVRSAIAMGHRVWTLTRGQHPVSADATSLVANRKDHKAFEQAVTSARTHWDLVVDCIGYTPEDVQLDIAVLAQHARHLVFVSTDFVYDPAHRHFLQTEETDFYLPNAYGGLKRKCELEFMKTDTRDMAWSIIRSCHIYGPGSELGCLPSHSRDPQLIAKLLANEPLQLVGGGYFLQQPVFAEDLAQTILSMAGNPATYGQIFCVAGPEIAESRQYYQIIAKILEVDIEIVEIPVNLYLHGHPESAPFLCHRIYNLHKLQNAGVTMPATFLEKGLRTHVADLLRRKLLT